jgi:hypothetical protein
LVTVTLPADWEPVIRWTGSWFGRPPPRSQAVAGLEEFPKAVRFENCQVDGEMVKALRPAR